MKILHVGKWYPWTGGIETVRDDIAYAMSEQGIICDMLCEAPMGSESKVFTINNHCKVIAEKTSFKLIRVPISIGFIKKLRKIASHYDIIHIHQPDPIAIVALWLSAYKGKVVTHWHCDISEYSLLLKLYKPVQDWILKRADKIIVTTQITADESPYLKSYKDKFVLIPIGSNQPSYYPILVEEIKKKFEGKKIIFAMGRMAKYKGFNYLIDASKKMPIDSIVLIGGKGPSYNELKQQIVDSQLDEKVKLLGFLSAEEVSAYYDACSVFCMPSIDKREAFGIVQVEAMAHSKPVVTTNIVGSGVPWVNKDGYSGLNVEVKNADALSAAINQLLSNDEMRKNMGINAKKRFDTLFTKNVMVSKVLDLYTLLLKY